MMRGDRWVRRGDVLWRQTAGTVLVLAPGADQPVALTGPGVAIWHLLTVPMTTHAIVSCMADLYRDPARRMAEDVNRLLAAMATQHLLEQSS
ncbi:MAG TPA: PqqD family protein [Nitriliruptorales bacterium]|nr:PqqD family protein [Nitriliruptorales bacterium]